MQIEIPLQQKKKKKILLGASACSDMRRERIREWNTAQVGNIFLSASLDKEEKGNKLWPQSRNPQSAKRLRLCVYVCMKVEFFSNY